MSEKVSKKVIFLLPDNGKSAMKRLLNQMGSNHAFEFSVVSTPEEALLEVVNCNYGLFLIETIDKPTTVMATTVLKKGRKYLKGTNMKIGAFNHLANPKVEKGLKKLGVADFVDIYINPKSFTFKLDFWFKTLKPKEDPNAADDEMNYSQGKGSKAGANAQGEAGEAKGGAPNMVIPEGPMENLNDIWLMRDTAKDCKNVLRKWLIKMVGPSSHAGGWEQLPSATNSNKLVWKFIIQDEHKEMFIESETGHWCFEGGSKPEFDWKENKWIFIGRTPSLYFEEGKSEDFKFQYTKEGLKLHDNSMFAETKEQYIVQTFDKEFTFGGDEVEEESKENVEDKNKDIKGYMEGDNFEEDLAGKMKGDVKDAADEGGHLEGASKGEGDVAGNMKGDVKDAADEGGHLEGASKGDGDVAGNMKGDIKDAADEGGHLEGASKGDGDVAGNMKGDVKDGKDASGDLQGKAKAEEEIDKFYKGDEQAQKAKEAKDKKAPQGYSEGDLGGNMQADLESTDEMAAAMKGKTKTGADKSGNMQGNSETGADFQGGQMGGHNKYQEESQGDVEGAADRLKKHYDNKTKQGADNQPGSMSGQMKSGADRKGGAMAGQNGEEGSDEALDYTGDGKKKEYGSNDTSEMGDLFQFGSKKKNSRDDKASEMEDILSDKSYKESDPSYEVDEEAYQASKNKSGPNYERDDDELEINPEELETYGSEDNVIDFPPQMTEEEEMNLEELTASGEIQIVIEHADGEDTTKYMAGFEDMYLPELVVSLPKGVMSSETNVRIYMLLKYLENKVSMNMKGSILEVEDDEEKDIIVIELQDYKEERVKQFMDLYMKRQENIAKFLSMAKGF